MDGHLPGGVIPAKAGIHEEAGFRIRSGMTDYSRWIFVQPVLFPHDYALQNRAAEIKRSRGRLRLDDV
jgi:hypothetical protein